MKKKAGEREIELIGRGWYTGDIGKISRSPERRLSRLVELSGSLPFASVSARVVPVKWRIYAAARYRARRARNEVARLRESLRNSGEAAEAPARRR